MYNSAIPKSKSKLSVKSISTTDDIDSYMTANSHIIDDYDTSQDVSHAQDIDINSVQNNQSNDIIQTLNMQVKERKVKKPRATSSYYEPHEGFDFNEEADTNPIPDIDYRKSYALTNEYKNVKNQSNHLSSSGDQVEISNNQNNSMNDASVQDNNKDEKVIHSDVESEDEQCNNTYDSILPDNVNEAKEKLRKTMMMSESLFENQKCNLRKRT